MKKPAKISINLLPKDPFLASPIGRLMQWALSIGRYLVIFTELVVIISFATRFNLDRQITDLNSKIHQRQIIIESYGDLEQQVRTIQKKITSYQQIEQQINIADTFPALSQITPQDVRLTDLTIQPNLIIFSGRAQSSTSLNLLVNNIQLSPNFANVTVDQIENQSDKDPGFAFKIHANVVRQQQPQR